MSRHERYRVDNQDLWFNVSEDGFELNESDSLSATIEKLSLNYGCKTEDFMETGKLINIVLLDENGHTFKVETYQDTEKYFAFIYQKKYFRMTPSFPQNENGTPQHSEDAKVFVRLDTTPTATSPAELQTAVRAFLAGIDWTN